MGAMPNYKIIIDEPKLDDFIAGLPDIRPYEVWYVCLFGRHKYDQSFPNTKDAGQLARVLARSHEELKEKLRRLEVPLGSYSRDGAVASQDCLAVYMALNPRSLIRANKALLIELAGRFAGGHTDFNPVSLSTTCVHRAIDRKFYVDFDFDDADPADHLPRIREVLPDQEMYRVLRTRGGFHLLVLLEKIRGLKSQWHPALSKMPGCDVRGSDTLTPVPGCTQGGFVPYFMV